jgi:hypothetical protein
MKKRNDPTCEVCGKEPATSFSYFGDRRSTEPNGEWKLTGACTTEIEDYYVEFDQLFRSSTRTEEWLAHLSGKEWLNRSDFGNAMA